MALRGAAARRYAQAVFDIAAEQNALDQWLGDLRTLNTLFGSEQAVSAIEDPEMREETQRRVIDDVLSREKATVNPLALNLMYMLVQRQRLGLLPRILQEFQEMYNRAKGIVVAEVTSAVPLDEAHQRAVAAELEKITGKTVQLQVRQDPRILGGLITRIGDQLIDSSVASRLAELGERLS